MSEYDRLAARIREGHVPSAARAISLVEGDSDRTSELMAEVYAAGGNAHILGITGAPGSGKSTLVNAFAKELRARGKTVGIVAVDPSSSLSGGAILGDRIRMSEHALDPGIFVRSMSTRGSLGGISRATLDAVAVLDAAGRDYVVVETVGVGQAEVEIVRSAHTTAVVSVPGLGDDIQMIKAGLLEVADVHVVNKADRPDANKTISELLNMLTLAGPPAEGGWAVPVVATVALDGTGIGELADAFDAHYEWMKTSGELARRERASTAARIRSIVKEFVIEHLHDPSTGLVFEDVVEEVVHRRLDPRTAARQLIGSINQPADVPLETRT